MDQLPPDFFVTAGAYTPNVYRDVYPSIDPTSPSLSQADKVVIITGASAGIGARGLTPAFAKAGAKAIVLVGRNKAKLEETAATIEKLNPKVKTLVCTTSISDPAQVAALYAEIKSTLGIASVLINNAGTFASKGAIASSDPSEWWTDFEVNVKGSYLMTKGFLTQLGTSHGTVVNMSTGIATSPNPGLSSYGISKNALLQLTEYIAAENPHVTCVALQPGVVDTDMVIGMQDQPCLFT